MVAASYVRPIPDGLDPADAVALGTAVTGMGLRTAAGLQPGETVLVQGATGVAGRLAVKVARILGARRIVITGRDEGALRDVLALGADEAIDTRAPDDELIQSFTDARGEGYDLVIDLLWGRPTRILLRTLTPRCIPFTTQVLGVTVKVEAVDLTADDQIVAVCSRDRQRQRVPILDLPLPDLAPEGADWIDAYRAWTAGMS